MNARIVLALALAASGCASHPSTCGDNAAHYAPDIRPENFTSSTAITNHFFPLTPDTVFKYQNTDGSVTTTTVTSDTNVVIGIAARVVHDVATTAAGDVLEDTFDYYAQDNAGAVWYFGEDTKAYSGGTVSTAGSWQGGVDCAWPGIIMPASPTIGDRYYQEYLEGSAEDEGQIVSLGETVVTPLQTFTGCVMTVDTTALESGVEHKYYCPDFGLVSSVDLAMPGGTDQHEDIIMYTPGRD